MTSEEIDDMYSHIASLLVEHIDEKLLEELVNGDYV